MVSIRIQEQASKMILAFVISRQSNGSLTNPNSINKRLAELPYPIHYKK